jgi:hypothetical protein
MRPSHWARRLRDLGVPVAAARPSALAALAHRIPAPVLADLLGFGAQTICNAHADLKEPLAIVTSGPPGDCAASSDVDHMYRRG